MSDELKKLTLFGLLAAGGLTLMLLLVPKLLGAAAGPETEVLTVLKEEEARGLTLPVGGSAKPLTSERANYQRLSVTVQGPDRAVVTATLDFDGTFGATQVSSLGAERIPFRLSEAGWEPTDGFAPQLSNVVRALELRRRALEAGDVSRLCSGRADAGEGPQLAALLRVQRRKLTAVRWLIRSEREGVVVTEDWRLEGDLPERPVDDRGSRRLALEPAEPGQFCFPDGLM